MDGLQGVRRRIADELVAVERECGHLSEFDHARLEKHASIFNRLLGSFGGSYAPLFAKIKSVYDRAIDERLKAVACLKPKEVILRSFDGFDLNLQSIHDTYHRQTKGDREKLAKLKPETDLLSNKLEKKQAELDRIVAEEKAVRDQMKEMDEWQHTLSQHMRAWDKALQQLHHQADTNDDSAWKTNQDIARSQDKISNTMSTVERKVGPGGDLEEKQGELRTVVNGILNLHHSIQVCSADVRKTEKTVKEFRVKLSKMNNELRVQKERAVNRQSAVTPVPDWDDVATSLEKVMPLDISNPQGSGPERKRAKYKSTADLVTSLTDGIAKLSADLMEARQDLLRENTAQDGEEIQGGQDSSAQVMTKWLVCHGRANNVPPYLRATGRVKNKQFTRQQVLAFLDEYWNAKSAGSRSRAQSPADFLTSFIRNKNGAGRMAVEWAYNLIYALKVYSADPDCETFNCILNGELPEDAHHGQRLLITNLLNELKKADKQNHGGRMWGTLDRTEFAEVLRRQFPLKSEDDFKALRRAVAADQPLPDIRYGPLLEKNPETGLQGKFLETLREQYISDVQQSYPMVEAAIRNATLEANERTQKVVKIEGHQTYPYLQLLKEVPLFRHCEMSDDQLEALILEMDIVEFHEEDIIIAEGTTASHAFVLEEGSAYVTKEGIAQPLNCNYQVGDFFGELGLRQGDPRAANVIARAGPRGICRCIRISADAFNKVRLASHQNEALLNQRVMQYFMATKAASIGTRASREENKEHHSLVTYVKCIKEGFAAFDADMPEREVNRLLKVGLGIDPDDDRQDRAVSPRSPGADGESPRASGPIIDDETAITLALFMSNIRRTVIKRFAKPKQQTEGEKRAQFLRNISDTERERITECFNELDYSGDGTLDQDEIEGLLTRIYGMKPNKKQLAQLMLEMDSDGNGLIDLDEFIGAMATVKDVRMAGELFRWRQTFDRYDEDKSGELSTDELRKMVSELWDMGSASLELMQFMIDEADINGDGQIDWPEFCQMMQRMMDDDEKKLEMKRQRTVVAAQGSPESKAVTQEGAQEALGRGLGIAKEMGWDIDLGLNDHPDAMDALWQKVANNDTATFAGLQRGLLETFPALAKLFNTKKSGSRITMRAFRAVLASTSVGEGGDDGLISRDDFPRFIVYIEFFSNLWEHFVSLDEDKDGKLNVAEFKSAFRNILPEVGHKTQMPEEELDRFLDEQHAKCDANGSGCVSFDEFSAWIASYYHEIVTEK